MRKQSAYTDAKGRLTLGQEYSSSLFLIEELNKGEFLLKKAKIIPERELWLHENEKAKKKILKGIEQARQGELEENAIDLDQYED